MRTLAGTGRIFDGHHPRSDDGRGRSREGGDAGRAIANRGRLPLRHRAGVDHRHRLDERPHLGLALSQRDDRRRHWPDRPQARP